MSYELDGKMGTITAGEKVTIPPKAVHTFWLASDAEEDLDVTATLTGGVGSGLDEYISESPVRYDVD